MYPSNQFDQEKTQGVDPRADGFIGESCNVAPTRPICSDADIVRELFSYHPPTPFTLPKFAAINQAAKNFAEVILQNCPPSADRSAAIRQIREARMTANAAIALDGLSL